MMRVSRRGVLAFVASAFLAAPVHAATLSTVSLDGEWEGTLTPATGEGIARPPDERYPPIRLSIDQRNVRVYIGGIEVKAGTFTIERETTNAVITSIQANPDVGSGQGWVETWTFVVTIADPDTLAVTFVRVVNNNHMTPSDDESHFTQVHTGQFHRVDGHVR